MLHSGREGEASRLHPLAEWVLSTQRGEAFAALLKNNNKSLTVALRQVRVTRLADKGPAALSGEVRLGDVLLYVNGKDISGKPMCELAKLVLGVEGSKVKLDLARRGRGRFSVVLTRGKVAD